MMIETKVTEGRTYYMTEARGVEYLLTRDKFSDGWELHSNRKACSFMGTSRRFPSLEAIESSIKAFRGISAIIN